METLLVRGKAHRNLDYSFRKRPLQCLQTNDVKLERLSSAAPPPSPLPASPTFSPYLPRFSNLSIFSTAAVCDCAPLRNRTDVGERKRDIRNGRRRRRRGICRDYSASAIDHKKRKSPAAHPLSRRNIQTPPGRVYIGCLLLKVVWHGSSGCADCKNTNFK